MMRLIYKGQTINTYSTTNQENPTQLENRIKTRACVIPFSNFIMKLVCLAIIILYKSYFYIYTNLHTFLAKTKLFYMHAFRTLSFYTGRF